MYRPRLPPGNIPGTYFCQRLRRPQGHSATEKNKSMKNSNDTIGNRARDLPVCSAVPQPTAPPRPMKFHEETSNCVLMKSVVRLAVFAKKLADWFARLRVPVRNRSCLYGQKIFSSLRLRYKHVSLCILS
jgi:hypothetical protein